MLVFCLRSPDLTPGFSQSSVDSSSDPLDQRIADSIQNLLPLFLRPLRLVLSHQQLRKLRISILKVTHLSIVGLILAWENGRLWLHDRPSAEKLGGSKRLSKRLSRKALVYPPSLAQETPSAAAVPLRDRQAASETIEDLGIAVNELKEKVEMLSKLLAKQTEVAQSL